MNIFKKRAVIIITFTILTLVSYVNFAQYKPKILRQLPDVKSAKTSGETLGSQIPQDSDRISINKSKEFNQVIFQSKKKKSEIQDFYKSVYSEPKWTKISEVGYTDYIITKYKAGEATITVTTFDLETQGNRTLVSLENRQE